MEDGDGQRGMGEEICIVGGERGMEILGQEREGERRKGRRGKGEGQGRWGKTDWVRRKGHVEGDRWKGR